MKKQKTHYNPGKVLSVVKSLFILRSSVFRPQSSVFRLPSSVFSLPSLIMISFWVKFLLNNNKQIHYYQYYQYVAPAELKRKGGAVPPVSPEVINILLLQRRCRLPDALSEHVNAIESLVGLSIQNSYYPAPQSKSFHENINGSKLLSSTLSRSCIVDRFQEITSSVEVIVPTKDSCKAAGQNSHVSDLM